MVIRNRHDGNGSPGDDFPARLRGRGLIDGAALDRLRPYLATEPPRRPPGPPPRRGWFGDFTRLTLLFLVVAVANIVFLLLAISYVYSGPAGADSPFPAPPR